MLPYSIKLNDNTYLYLGAPPTNKTIVMRSADLFRIEDGMIVEHWNVIDSLNFLTQTGGINFNQ
jgi:predicted SnoaL-like aldol condensation-catalyzing enzyme